MVAVPTDRTADVQHNLRGEEQQSGYLVGNALRQVEVTCVEGNDLLLLGTITQVEVV